MCECVYKSVSVCMRMYFRVGMSVHVRVRGCL